MSRSTSSAPVTADKNLPATILRAHVHATLPRLSTNGLMWGTGYALDREGRKLAANAWNSDH